VLATPIVEPLLLFPGLAGAPLAAAAGLAFELDAMYPVLHAIVISAKAAAAVGQVAPCFTIVDRSCSVVTMECGNGDSSPSILL
jgi:hypothetical protein